MWVAHTRTTTRKATKLLMKPTGPWPVVSERGGGEMSSMVQLARSQISRLPEVLAMVVTDRAGNLVESNGELDAEAAGAVYAVAAEALTRAGEVLGLGAF